MRSELQRLKRDTETGRFAAGSSGSVAVAQESGAQAAKLPSSASGSSPALAAPSSSSAKVAEIPVAGRKLWKVLVPAAVILIAAAIGGAFYFHSRSTKPATALTEKDSIVLADFANSTGDAVFDDTLKTALSVSLNQSPFLNVLSENKVAATLKLMSRPADTKLTPEVTRELCQRAGSKAYLAGSIASLGSQYVLGLKAVNCQSGDPLAEQQVTAAGKEKVLDGLGEAAAKLRTELGESLVTVQKLDVPLSEATTSSLEALKAYSLGNKAGNEKGHAAALPYHQPAIELDPNFAMGYMAAGDDYFSLAETGRASDYFTKAFQLREASPQIAVALTQTLATACSPCNASTKRGRSSTKRKRESWMITYSAMLSTLLPFSAQTLRRWRNSSIGMQASPKRTWDWRWHPTPKPMAVIWARRGN
jgi:eukaryotic-like serine/threonine-protein kinase